MSILILGAKGMLGRMLMEVVGQDQEVVGFDRDGLDITDPESIRRGFAQTKPSIVINAAGYTDVDGAETNADLANRVNGDAVGFLAQACIEHDATLVHYSTDYVFDGLDPRGYDEDAEPGTSVNAYGRSKRLGEEKLLSLEPSKLHYYLIRTSWLYGPWGKNFVDTMLKLGEVKKELRVADDQYGKSTYTYDLAHATREILEAEEEFETGIYHVTNDAPDGGITWYEFAEEIFRIAQTLPNGHVYEHIAVSPCGSDEYPRAAKRPTYSMLVNTKLFSRRSWEEALRDYLMKYHAKS